MERNIKLLAIHNFLTDFIFFAPIAILYFRDVSGSFTLGMSIFSITFLSAALFEIPTGVFSDMIGRKRTIILGSLSYFLAFVLYAIGGTYGILALGGILEGLARSFYSGNNNALLYDTLAAQRKEHLYQEYLGKTSSLFQIALAISAAIGSLVANWSFSWAMWLSVIPKMIGVIVSFAFLEPKVHSQKSGNVYLHLRETLATFRKNINLQYLTLAYVLKFSLGESGYQFRNVFIQTVWPIWSIGFVNTVSNAGAAVSFYFSGKILNKLSSLRALTIEIFYNRIINILSLLFPTVLSPILMSTTSLTFGIGSVALSSLSQKEFTNEQRATMGSLGSLFGSLAFGIVSLLVGYIGDTYGPVTALITTNLLLFAPLWLYYQIFKKSRNGL